MNINTLNSDHKLASWARLVRLHTMLPTALIPLIFYMAVEPIDVTSAAIIVYFASVSHLFTCTTNDLLDLADDHKAGDKQHRPLVSAEITVPEAVVASSLLLFFTLLSPLIAMFLYLDAILMLILLAITVIGVFASFGYNKYSGKVWYADLLYVTSILVLGAFGTALAGEITTQSILLFIAFAIHGLFQVQEGHMKDLVEDENNILQKVGVDVYMNGKVRYPYNSKQIAVVLKTIELASIIAIFASSGNTNLGIISLVALSSGAFIVSLDKWLVDKFDREEIIKYITVHELSSIILILCAVAPYDVNGTVFFIITTPTWLIIVNYFIHDNLLSPDI